MLFVTDNCMDIIIRKEKISDKDEIFKLNKQAFNNGPEAELVDRIRESDAEYFSFVAVVKGKIVGHSMYSTVYIDGSPAGLGLAPVAVLPEYQHKGIGAKLIACTLEKLKKYDLIVVLGDNKYYSRFGFQPASTVGLKSTYDVPDEYFMAISYNNAGWNNKIVRYNKVFDSLNC